MSDIDYDDEIQFPIDIERESKMILCNKNQTHKGGR